MENKLEESVIKMQSKEGKGALACAVSLPFDLTTRGAAAYFVQRGRPVFYLSFLTPQKDLKTDHHLKRALMLSVTAAVVDTANTFSLSLSRCGYFLFILWVILRAGRKIQMALPQGCAPTTSIKTLSPSWLLLAALANLDTQKEIMEARGWSWGNGVESDGNLLFLEYICPKVWWDSKLDLQVASTWQSLHPVTDFVTPKNLFCLHPDL